MPSSNLSVNGSSASRSSSNVSSTSSLTPKIAPKRNKPSLYLHGINTLQSQPSSINTSPIPPSAAPIPTHSTLRAQLNHLIPKHAFFHVRVNIHELSSVPLVHGEFGLRWKFKNVHSHPGHKSGLLGKVKMGGKDKDKEAEENEKDNNDSNAAEDSGSSKDNLPTVTGKNMRDLEISSIPSVVLNDHHQSTTDTPSISTRPTTPNPYAQYLLPPSIVSPSISSTRAPTPSFPSLSATTPNEAYAPTKGMTEYVKLKDHNVTWEHTVDVVVKMDVERDTLDLLPNELKLVVLQRVIPGDPDAPHNPRLGAVYLNLAEYANPGHVTRRYLLRQSKTNATLKLTIELEHVGGETTYKAPPLPKGEILGGLSGLLESDVYRTRPKALDLYGSYYDHRPDKKSGSGIKGRGIDKQHGIDGLPFDISQLPVAHGPRTTEALIEALFNPIPTSSTEESPFTYYVSPKPKVAKDRKGQGRLGGDSAVTVTTETQNGRYATEVSSLYSVGSSSESMYNSSNSHATSSLSSHHPGEKDGLDLKSWWRKISGSSRPGTPVQAV